LGFVIGAHHSTVAFRALAAHARNAQGTLFGGTVVGGQGRRGELAVILDAGHAYLPCELGNGLQHTG